MQQLFHSRRRKFGFVCLAVALLLTAVWGQSLRTHDIVNWTRSGDFNQIGSYRGGFYWIRTEQWWCDVPIQFDAHDARYGYRFGEWPGFENTSHREFVGFQVAEGIWHPPLLDLNRYRDAERLPRRATFHSWFVPYWALVLLITLLSAFLIALPVNTTATRPAPATGSEGPATTAIKLRTHSESNSGRSSDLAPTD